MNHEWIADADRAYPEGRVVLVGEDDYGDWWVGSGGPLWWKRFNSRNPLHWLAYWRSKRRNVVVWLERTWVDD